LKINEGNKEHLVIHIKGLQQTLSERNARIAELEKQLTKSATTARTKREIKKAYVEGWKACANRLREITLKTALDLSEIRKEAWQIYTEGENK